MNDVERGGAAGAETSDFGAVAAPGRDRRMTAGRKRDAVLKTDAKRAAYVTDRLAEGWTLEQIGGRL